MEVVKVYTTERGHPFWQKVADILKNEGVIVDDKISHADISIALSGRFINPLILNGKRVMAYDAAEWFGPGCIEGFRSYKIVLNEYYDDFINLTGLNVQQRVDEIIKYIKGEECLKGAR